MVLGIALFFKRSRFGLAIRAAAANPEDLEFDATLVASFTNDCGIPVLVSGVAEDERPPRPGGKWGTRDEATQVDKVEQQIDLVSPNSRFRG